MARGLLVGIVSYSHAKDYCHENFVEMMRACVLPCLGDDDEVIVVGDVPIHGIDATHIERSVDSTYAEDMLADGREFMLDMAADEGFAQMLWQGVDCYWQNKEDFLAVAGRGVSLVSALTCGRGDANYAVARRFVDEEGGQEDIPGWELERGGLVPAGFPGADAIFIDEELFVFPFKEGHIPWYDRVEQGMVNINVEEEWIFNMQRDFGIESFVDADIKVWHHHDVDNMCRMWKGIEVDARDLRWEG